MLTSKNHGKERTKDQEKKLKDLAKGNTPTGLIAYELGRTKGAISNHAGKIGLSLKPVNKSPYNRQKKS